MIIILMPLISTINLSLFAIQRSSFFNRVQTLLQLPREYITIVVGPRAPSSETPTSRRVRPARESNSRSADDAFGERVAPPACFLTYSTERRNCCRSRSIAVHSSMILFNSATLSLFGSEEKRVVSVFTFLTYL